jgi:hypothetical protein
LQTHLVGMMNEGNHDRSCRSNLLPRFVLGIVEANYVGNDCVLPGL